MPPELELALLLFVFDCVEKCAIVRGPDDGADALHFTGERFAGFEILDVKRVLAEAGGVGGVGEPAAVVGDVGFADGEEGVALGQFVAVENHLLGVDSQVAGVGIPAAIPRSPRARMGHPECLRQPCGN